jgi:hypothetical protein
MYYAFHWLISGVLNLKEGNKEEAIFGHPRKYFNSRRAYLPFLDRNPGVQEFPEPERRHCKDGHSFKEMDHLLGLGLTLYRRWKMKGYCKTG